MTSIMGQHGVWLAALQIFGWSIFRSGYHTALKCQNGVPLLEMMRKHGRSGGESPRAWLNLHALNQHTSWILSWLMCCWI